MTLLEELTQVVAELDAAGVGYALVGGLAVAVWGAPRATQDIDLLIRRETLDAALGAVAHRGFILRGLLMTFQDGMDLQRVSKIQDGLLVTIDFLIVNANLEPAWASRARLELAGSPLWVISREALIQMKIAAGRPQDVADVVSLQAVDR